METRHERQTAPGGWWRWIAALALLGAGAAALFVSCRSAAPPQPAPEAESGRAAAPERGDVPDASEKDLTLELSSEEPLEDEALPDAPDEPLDGDFEDPVAAKFLEELCRERELESERGPAPALELRAALDETAQTVQRDVAGSASRPRDGAEASDEREESLESFFAALESEAPRSAAAGSPATGGLGGLPPEPPAAFAAALRGDAPPPGGGPQGAAGAGPMPSAAPTPAAPPSAQTQAAAEERKPPARPKGYITFHTLLHKTADDAIRFLRDARPDWLENGHLGKVEGKAHTVVVFGETDDPADALVRKIVDMLERFDQTDLVVEHRVIKPRYIDATLAMDALRMAGICSVWQLAPAQDAVTWKEGDKTRTVSRQADVYIDKGNGLSSVASPQGPPHLPYVYEMPRKDAFRMPPSQHSISNTGALLMTFDKTSSTEERGGMLAVGTTDDLAKIEAFVETIDVPARRIMIEVQLIELDASKLTDLGIDSIQAGEGHTLGTLALPLPGESIVQPGIPDARRPGEIVPSVVGEGLQLLFDDTSFDLQGRFLASVHALVREGEAKVRARPKILTLDDRVSVLHLGRDVPTFVSSGVTRDATNGNLVSEVQQVGTVYAGITLHIRPRVTGGAHDRVALQIEVVDNQIVGRQQVFEEDLAGIPEVIKRQYIGEAVAHNHRPVILGGLIQEQEVESTNKLPLLGDIPWLGYLFRRTMTTQSRGEVIIVVTPHVLSEEGVDPAGTPKESLHFDTFDSVLFNDRHILKGSDVLGLDPMSHTPAVGPDGKPFEEEEVVDLTILNVVKKRELISKLKMLENYLSEEELADLSWVQRRWPESTVASWSDGDKKLFFRVAAILIENVKELNPELDFDDLVLPRREIILPTSPYKISLTYDRVRRVQQLGLEQVFRGERVDLEPRHVELVRRAAAHSLRAFGEFLARQTRPDGGKGRRAEDHGSLREELLRLHRGLRPDGPALEVAAYSDLWKELDRAGISFMSLAAYLSSNLEERYMVEGAPDVGAFAVDLEAFLKTTVTLRERAEKLRDLADRWQQVNTEPEGE